MYTPTLWVDHVTTPSNCYTIEDNGDGTYTIESAGTVMQQGTPQDQEHFGNQEDGIFDAHAAIALLVNALRQQSWEIETGEVELTNSLNYPFNNSSVTVSLALPKESTNYVVLTEVTDFEGNVGEVVVSDRLTNGFKLRHTGSAASATVKYTVIGGYMK